MCVALYSGVNSLEIFLLANFYFGNHGVTIKNIYPVWATSPTKGNVCRNAAELP